MEIDTIAEQLLFTTVPIETEHDDGVGTATGFLFNYELEDRSAFFLITNEHVLNDASAIRLTFTRAADEGPDVGNAYRLTIDRIGEHYTPHPDNSIDVAAIPLHPLLRHIRREGVNVFFRSVTQDHVATDELLADLDVVQEIVFVGYPSGIWDRSNLLPVFRRGTTATAARIDYEGRAQFLVDASVFPGSSGSPVFIYERGIYTSREGGAMIGGGRFAFLGVISSVYYHEEANELRVSQQLSSRIPFAVSQEKIDLGLVFKARTVTELIEHILRTEGLMDK